MRISILVALLVLAASTQASAALSWGQYAIRAGNVTFYAGRYILTADGNVMVILPDGGTIAGDTFAMDLKLNRFIVAGNVVVKDKGVELHAAAVSRFFLPFERSYVVPVLAQPDRWTFESDDFKTPLKGRDMPGDTFFLPDLSRDKPFVVGKRALLVPGESVKISPGNVVLGIKIPSPTYFVNLSSNPNYYQNSLAGAEFDGPYPFAGGTRARSTLHVRYDPINKLYLSYEQQLAVTDHSYISASVNPMTRPQRQYNLIADDKFSPNFEGRTFLQESAFQQWLTQPLSASAFIGTQLTLGLPHSYLQYNQNFYYGSLLAMPMPDLSQPVQGQYYYGDPSHPWAPGHPSDGLLSWIGVNQRFWKLPLRYQLRSGFGYSHTTVINEGFELTPPPELGNTLYPTIWRNFVGATLTTDSFKIIRDQSGLHRDLIFNAYADLQRQAFSLPHHTDTIQVSGSLSTQFTPALSGYVNYQIQNIRDDYGSQQLSAYVPSSVYSPVTNQTYTGYEAFIGFATIRSWTQALIFTPTQAFQLSVTMRENHDFPNPIPGPEGPLVGFAPLQLTPQVRMRLLPNLQLTLSRAYYFHFGIQNWDPQFTFQFTK